MSAKIDIPRQKIVEFCRKWQIKELSIFGSALNDDFRPDSDIDVLVVYNEEAKPSLFDYMEAQRELEELFGRQVDLVEKNLITNPFRRHHILSNHEVIYASGRA